MKIHKNNVKLYFKDKNTIIALCLLFVFLCAFLISFAPFATSVKGISEMFSTSKIQDLYSNNYSTIYAVDEDNVLHYSFDKIDFLSGNFITISISFIILHYLFFV